MTTRSWGTARPEMPIATRKPSSCAKELAKLAAKWAATRLVELWNSLPGQKPVKKFADRKAAAGTRFLGRKKSQATVVARLRTAGALLVGKTNMHEIGILPDGLNAHYGPVRNPYGLACEAGGCSSGSAAAVAVGFCAAAIRPDGGGSIRIPASYCGVVGLKPTFGRVSEFGAVPLAWSVGHVGPIATTAQDAAQVYAAIAGPDP
jgi:Asp-tRNA(Asn)/Glu-tRNA(Gln) amidotransferase A subunit family amidase